MHFQPLHNEVKSVLGIKESYSMGKSPKIFTNRSGQAGGGGGPHHHQSFPKFTLLELHEADIRSEWKWDKVENYIPPCAQKGRDLLSKLIEFDMSLASGNYDLALRRKDGGLPLWRFPLPLPCQLFPCSPLPPAVAARSANQSAAFARHCEATQPLEGRGARLWGIWGNPGMIYLKLQCTQ